jgi:acetyltransferase-like isoleucine patch superfamily enzyme
MNKVKTIVKSDIYNVLYHFALIFNSLKRKMHNALIYNELKKIRVTGKDVWFSYPYYLFGEKYMKIGTGFGSSPGLRIECIDEWGGGHYHPQLIIGDYVNCNYYCHIGCMNKITIGDHVTLGSRVLITDHAHGELSKSKIPYFDRKLISKGPVTIGNNVWIGENACIMPGVTIGEGCIIGANAVVTHDVPPYSLAAGVPSKVIKTLQ